MNIETKKDILDLLALPYSEFSDTVAAQARAVHERANGGALTAAAMLGFSNICKNRCLYCGMRADSKITRYRIPPEEVVAAARRAREAGFRRFFLISGEDPKYGFGSIVAMTGEIAALGLRVSLACGEFDAAGYAELKAAGAAEYVIKFEMGQEAVFDRLNPSTTFKKRMASIEAVRKSGLRLASGNIVDYPGQTAEALAEDILLMKELDISWAPVIPYLPAAGTPLAAEGGRGSVETALREIAILRLLLPECRITAQQPGQDLRLGLAGEEGNLAALRAGADLLFADMLPAEHLGDFSVVDERVVLGLSHIRRMSELSGMPLRF